MRNQVQEIVSSMKEKSNFTPEYCVILGSGFVNMTELYSQKMILKAKELAQKMNIEVKEGVYLGLQGPTFETLSEYRMAKNLGADCVGMSTVPEVIVARHMNMECFGLFVITNMGEMQIILKLFLMMRF